MIFKQKTKSYSFFCDQIKLVVAGYEQDYISQFFKARLAEKNMQQALCNKVIEGVNEILSKQFCRLNYILESATIGDIDKINAIGLLAYDLKKALFFERMQAIGDEQKVWLAKEVRQGYLGCLDKILATSGHDVDNINIDFVYCVQECKNRIANFKNRDNY